MGKGARIRETKKRQVEVKLPTARNVFLRQLAIALAAGGALAAIAIGVSVASRSGPPPPVLPQRARVNSLLRGIPQHGTTLGRLDAPLTMVEYIDPQCPYCREWTMATLDEVISKYIRPG